MNRILGLGSVVCWLLALTNCATAPPQEPLALLDHAALHVADLEKSASFYETLGLKRIADPFKDGRLIWLSAGPHRQLHLVAGRAESSAPDMPVHLAFAVPSIPVAAARLEAAGVPYYNSRKEPHTVSNRPDGVKQIYLQDPDGYWVELNDAPGTGRR
jgi:lactoylglutathione lyase